MTKRIFAMVLALCMVLSLVPVVAVAETATVSATAKAGTHTAAGHSDDCGLTEGWLPWEQSNSLPTSGQYYLTKNVTLTGEVQISGDLTLCLNGYVISTTGTKRVLSTKDGSGLTFTVTDCTAYTENDVYYAGAITGGKDASAGGGAVFVRRSTTMKLYDGRLTQNTSSIAGGGVALQASGNNHAGAIMYMYGGEISDNTAINGTTYKVGGAVYLGAGCLFEMTGGTISGNKGSGGGAIYAVGTNTVTLKNATITGNTASYTGAVLHCANATTVTIQDSDLSGNTCTNASAGGTIRMDGAAGTVTLSGATVIANNTLAAGIGDIMLMNAAHKLTVDGLTIGSNVRFCAPNTTVTAAGDVITATENQTDWDNGWVTFVNKDGTEQRISYNGTAFSFAQGHFHGSSEFIAWDKTDSLPASGAYYLTQDVTVSKQITLSDSLELCLNGHTVTGYKGRAYDVAATGTLKLYNCGTEASFTGFSHSAHGGVIQSAGTVYAENITFQNNTTTNYGGAFLSTGGTATFKDCTFHKNTAAQGGALSIGGEAVVENCTFTENSGTATCGAIRAAGTKTVLVKGCTLTGNTAKTVSAIGATSRDVTLTIQDSTITGNTNTNGYGAVNMYGTAKNVILLGKVTVTGNTRGTAANNLHVQNGAVDGYDVSGLTAGSSLGISLEGARITAGKLTFTAASSANNSSYFSSDDDAYAVELNSDNQLALKLIPVSDHKHDLCGNTDCADHDYVEYFAWDKTDSLPTNGNWYLTADVTVSAETAVSGTLNLCLNGYTVTGWKGRAFNASGTLNLCSCKAGAAFTGFGNNAHGGVIQSSGTVYAENITFRNNDAGTGYGGVLLSTGGTVTFQNCTFTENTAAQGSALSVAGTTTLTGCTFADNTATASGTLRAVGTKPILVENCTFTGNTAKVATAIQTAGSTLLTLKDVTITGNTNTAGFGAVNATGSIKPIVLQGKVIITGNTTNGQPNNLHLQNGTTDGYDVSGLTAGSSIGVSLEGARITAGRMHFTTANANNNPGYFTSDSDAYEPALGEDNKLMLQIPVPPITHIHCICGKTANSHCDHTNVDFMDWTDPNALPTEGSWCLTVDVTVPKQFGVSKKLDLCLNGHNIRVGEQGGRVYYCAAGAKLSITDCAKTPGTISGATNTAILFNASSTDTELNLWNGIFTDNHIIGAAGAISIQGETVFNMYGGAISGNSATSDFKLDANGEPILDADGNPTYYNANGGGLYSGTGTTFNMYGGEISDNTCTHLEFTKKGATSVTKVGGYGGGAALYGSSNLYGGRISGNSGFLGGGLFTSGSTTVMNLMGTEISGNRATSAGGVLNQGRSTVNLSAGLITGNTATLSGGGLYVSINSKFHMTGGTVSDNSAANNGGGIYLQQAQSTVTGGTISGNKSAKLGGGFYITDKGAELTIDDALITKNEALSGAGIFAYNDSVLTVNGGRITANSSNSAGGGISAFPNVVLTVNGGSITNNTAKNDGGGIYLLRTKSTLKGATISGNTAANGGGVKIAGGNVSFSGTSITGNKAVGKMTTSSKTGELVKVEGSGGGIHISQAGYTENGVQKNETATVTASGIYVAGNLATSAAGGILVQSQDSRFTMYSGTVTGNEATAGGGGIYFSTNTICKILGGTVSNNTSLKAGGIFILNCTADLSNVRMTGNTAGSIGGAFVIMGATTLVNMKNMEITGNVSEATGGVWVIQNYATVNMEDSVISGNSAKTTGGMYFSNPTYGNFKNVEIYENTSQTAGGAIYTSSNCVVNLEDCTVRNNSSESSGGGIYNKGRVALTNCKVLNNTSGKNGGGIGGGQSGSALLSDKSGVYATDTVISGNSAAEQGGGVFNHRGNPVYLTGCTVTDNTSGLEGSGIYANGRLGLENVTVTGNTATNGGYAVYVAGSEYDGHSYTTGHRWLSGKMVIRDNQGGDMYLCEGAFMAVTGESLGEGSHVELTLQNGLLTQQIQGVYDYELNDGIYTMTSGSRSITDPEVYAESSDPTESQPSDTAGNNTLLYVAVGIFAVLVVAVILLLTKKKKAQKATQE